MHPKLPLTGTRPLLLLTLRFCCLLTSSSVHQTSHYLAACFYTPFFPNFKSLTGRQLFNLFELASLHREQRNWPVTASNPFSVAAWSAPVTDSQTDRQTDSGDSVKIKVARLCLIDNDGKMSRGRLCAERPSPLVSPAINSLLLTMTQSITIELNLLSVSCR